MAAHLLRMGFAIHRNVLRAVRGMVLRLVADSITLVDPQVVGARTSHTLNVLDVISGPELSGIVPGITFTLQNA